MVALGYSVTCFHRKGHYVSGQKFDGNTSNDYKGVKLKTVPTIDKKGLATMSVSFFATIQTTFGKYEVIHFHAERPCAMI